MNACGPEGASTVARWLCWSLCKRNNMDISRMFDRLIEMDSPTIMRWISIFHNSIAPGYLIVFTFYNDTFNSLVTSKLVLLALCISTPIFYFIFTAIAHLQLRGKKPTQEEKILYRIRTLLFTTMIILVLNSVLLIYERLS